MEVTDVATLRSLLATRRRLTGVRVQDVDLTPVAPHLLARRSLRGLVVLGGVVPPAVATHLSAAGAVVFPASVDAPVNVYRSSLYTPAQLYDGLERGYDTTPDALAYHWSRDARLTDDVYATVLRGLHDDAIEDALREALDGLPVVGVMGGHDVVRGSVTYADAARLGHAVASAGRVVLTGGGPGAMEAANLGAWCADSTALASALQAVAAVPSFRPSIDAWAGTAFAVRAAAEGGPRAGQSGGHVRSIGVPTWFYGHEPPNVFCDAIAKFFSNALREDLLLAASSAGIVVLPGAAGTVQEIFQVATRLYYAARPGPPLILVDETHWTTTVPVWPALSALASGRAMAHSIHLVDSVQQATDLLLPPAGEPS